MPSREPPRAGATLRPDVVQELRTLLRCLPPLAAPGGIDAEEILLDLTLDSARFLLVRMPVAEPARISLSPREQEIARMVAAGHPSKTIASVLSISAWTVGTHLRRIFAKFGVRTRAAMVAKMLEAGLVSHACGAVATSPRGTAAAVNPQRRELQADADIDIEA